jgi:hypothetical protein
LDELLERLEFFFHFAQPQTRRMEIVELIERLPAFLALHGNEFYVMKRNSAELNKKVDDLENRLLLVEGEHATFMTEHATLENRLMLVEGEGVTLMTEHASLKNRLLLVEGEHATLMTEHATFMTEHATLMTDHATLMTDHATLMTDQATLMTEHASLEKRLLLVEGEHATLMTEHTKKNQLLMFADLFKVYRAYHADSSLLAHGVADDWYELKRTLKQKKQELFQKKITSADYDQYFKKAQDALGYLDIDLLTKLLKDRNDDCHHDIDDPQNQASFLIMCQKETFIAEIRPIAEVFIKFLTKIKFDKFVS